MKYTVAINERHLSYYEIEAESPEEAQEKVMEGDGDLVHGEYVEVLGFSSVELAPAQPANPTEGRTIWNSDGTDGPVLICPPPEEKN